MYTNKNANVAKDNTTQLNGDKLIFTTNAKQHHDSVDSDADNS